MPNPGNTNTGSAAEPNEVSLVVSRPFTGNSLNSPISRVKIYSLVPNPVIRIYGFGQCSYLTHPTDHDSNTADVTRYRFFRANAAEDQPVGAAPILDTNNGARCSASSWLINNYVQYSLTGGVKSTVVGHGSYYVFIFQGDMVGTAVNGFKLWTSSGIIGYSNDSSDKFALQNRNGLPDAYTNYTMPFAPDCSVTTNRVVPLRWYDDDWGTLQTNASFVFDVVDITTGTTIVNNFGPRLGSGVSGSINITVIPKHKYEWRWFSVRNNNGIQFQLPFDSIFYNTTCVSAVPTGTANYACHRVAGTATDPDRVNFAMPILVSTLPVGTAGAVQATTTTNATTHAFTLDTWLAPFFANDVGFHSYYVYTRNITSTGAIDPSDTGWKPLTGGNPTASLQCPPVPKCGSLITAPGKPETGTSANLTVDVDFSATAPFPTAPAYVMTLQITDPGGTVQNFPSIAYTASASGAVSAPFAYTPATGGTYNVHWDFNGAGINIPGCNGTFSAYNKPYFKVYGGDVVGGADFGPTCSTNDNSTFNGIGALNRGAAQYIGASTQVAAIAAGAIDGFVSASLRGSAPVAPLGLSFANDSPAVDPYGGNYKAMPCLPNYWSLAPASPPTSLSLGATTVAAGTPRDEFVHGDVYITGNITYGGAGWSRANMPSFRLIVYGGDIFVAPSVTQLDGLYVAIPEGNTGGKIYTCAVGSSPGTLSPPSEANIANPAVCGANQLVVNGAMIANQVKLLRTYGTLRNGVAGEVLGLTTAAGAGRAGEVFVFGPEIWLATPETAAPTTVNYDAITSLPPVL